MTAHPRTTGRQELGIDDAEIEAVADYLRRTRFQRDRPVRKMAREALEIAEEVRSGTRRKLSEAEIVHRDADRSMQRHRSRGGRQ